MLSRTNAWRFVVLTWFGLVAVLLAPTHAAAQTRRPARAATQPATRPVSAGERVPEYPQPKPIPTDLLRQPGQGGPLAIILPSAPPEDDVPNDLRSGGIVSTLEPAVQLLPEGYVIARRPGVFKQDGPWLTVKLGESADLPPGPPLRVLPNRRLMLLERLLAEDTAKANETYLVTGRVTEFLGHNYVLLENVVTPGRPLAPTGAKNASEAARAGAAQSRPTRPPTADEIMELLMQERPARALTAAPSTSGPAVAEKPDKRFDDANRVFPEGTLVPEFPTRLLQEESARAGWLLVRESQGSKAAGKPYQVLPSRLLEVMVSTSAGGTRGIVFLVSGELTEYRGGNYLFVRKVLIRRETGNLR